MFVFPIKNYPCMLQYLQYIPWVSSVYYTMHKHDTTVLGMQHGSKELHDVKETHRKHTVV